MSFLEIYQHLPSFVNPVIFTIGGLPIRWYSVGYIVAFLLATYLVKYRIEQEEIDFKMKKPDADELMGYLIIGVILGGRLGYVFFYQFEYYLSNPLEAILPFRFGDQIQFVGISGLSYHGGMIGCLLFFYLFARKKKFPLIDLMDLYASTIPIGYMFGRFGNFMNRELYGRVTDQPWGMYFLDYNGRPFLELRHPSQLYEAVVEGLLLFIVLWFLRKRVAKGILTGLYFIGYGLGRFLVEFFREPDDFFREPGKELGTVFFFFSMGQVLCFFMIVFGLAVIYYYRSASSLKSKKI